jgi:hypothetical protein
MEVDEQLLKEIKKDLLMQKIYGLFHNHKKSILIVIFACLLLGIGFLSYKLYVNNLANKDSLIFNDVKELLAQNKNEEALLKLDGLIKDGTNGYAYLSYMEKAYLYLSQNDNTKAVEVLQIAYKEVSLPKYYKNIIKNIEFIIRMNSNIGSEELLVDVKNSLDKNNHLYFNNLEIYYSLLIKNKDYSNAKIHIEEIINAKEVPIKLKDRAKRIKSLLMGYSN